MEILQEEPKIFTIKRIWELNYIRNKTSSAIQKISNGSFYLNILSFIPVLIGCK
jgi:hypothetical protein